MNFSDLVELVERAQDFLDSAGFDMFVKLALGYLVLIWLASVIWVGKDVIARTNNIFFQILMIGLNIILPFFGLVVYLMVRPQQTLLEKYYEDIEYKALTEGAGNFRRCWNCEVELERGFVFCPECGERVQSKCGRCRRFFEVRYKICPYCGAKSNVEEEEGKKEDKKKISGKGKDKVREKNKKKGKGGKGN